MYSKLSYVYKLLMLKPLIPEFLDIPLKYL
jgi:hypothetical protein